jgi:hypothetical protein
MYGVCCVVVVGEGVEEVTVDCRTNTVIVRGPKAAVDPAGIVEVLDRRTGKKALLLSSLPSANLKPPLSPEKRSSETAKKDAAEQDMGKEMSEEDMLVVKFGEMIECQEMVVVMRHAARRSNGGYSRLKVLRSSICTVHLNC